MESSTAKPASHNDDCVRVAVNIRPLITMELLLGCTDCITAVPGEPQIQIGAHSFTYDYVYGSTASPLCSIYEECVSPLVDALFHGYNATVLTYGQTGSGKTYTMGTNYTGDDSGNGIIPKVMDSIFKKIEVMKETAEFLIRVSFIEIFKEEVFDLLDMSSHNWRNEGASLAKPVIPARVPIQIRETGNGGISLAGVTEAEVCSKEEMASFLARGSVSRATGSTNMNSQSSRSHAIFTITMEQKRNGHSAGLGAAREEIGDDILCAKLHLVDLAGSERAKRTGADGLRLKEGIHINRGLLALGNVISALGDEKKRKEGGHVPYRDSKLTRLLQDSLGGNSKTVMIACVSPADTNAEETINTLKYANRARNIQNKAVVNRDPVAAEMQRMRSQVEQLQAELLCFRSGGAPLEELQVLVSRISSLEATNKELRQHAFNAKALEHRISMLEANNSELRRRVLDAEVEKDKLILKLDSARNGKSWDEIDNFEKTQDFDLLKGYISKIQELEMEILQLRSSSRASTVGAVGCLDFDDDDGLQVKNTFLARLQENASGEIEEEEEEKELEHSTLQDKLGKELKELDMRLELKEEEMKRFSKTDTSVLKQHYEKKLFELEHEKKVLLKEIEDLRLNLANISSTPDDGAKKLKEDYLQKLNILESQVSDLKKKQEAQSQLLRQKQKSDEAAKRLQEEIQRIKSQKVQLQHKIKQESEQFRSWKASREKEVLQLKKEGRRNEYEMHKLLALNQRQKMVLQRKTEEASLATKRLKEVLEVKKTSREMPGHVGSGNLNDRGVQSLMQAIEHELEVTVRVHEVRSEYQKQLEARAAMANEMSKLKDEYEKYRQKKLSDCPTTMSPSARNSRISALENMLATSSSTLVSMASQLSEAEERRAFSGRGRWNQVRSLPEAKNLMNHLFNLASSSRCQLRDSEVACLEKDSLMRDLKEKIVLLNSSIRELETQRAVMQIQEKRLVSANPATEASASLGSRTSSFREDEQFRVLRKAPRKTQFFGSASINDDLWEDMDTSDSEQSESDFLGTEEEDSDGEWVKSTKKVPRRRSRRTEATKSTLNEIDPLKPKVAGEKTAPDVPKHQYNICCTCSKSSSCKTKKCECRGANTPCGDSCSCMISKCANREGGCIKKGPEEMQTYMDEHAPCDRTVMLASEGALLLQSALAEKSSSLNENMPPQRRPLSDIGNKVVSSNAPKPNKRKNWRKSTAIQLVPVAQLVPSQPVNGAGDPHKVSDDIPLKLPRAMGGTTHPNSNPLGERNAVNSDEPTVVSRVPRDPNDKENGTV